MPCPKFSIVIPLYNKEKYIGRALKSVLSQTFTDWECIIVDDGSTDQSLEVVSKFKDSRIKVVRQKNSGPSAARNRGAKEARAEWIALLDADDYWLENHLEDLWFLIEKFPDCGVVGTNFWNEDTFGKRGLANQFDNKKNFGIYQYFLFVASRKGPLVCSSSTAVKKSVWIEVGGFREKYRLAEDADFWARLSLKTNFAVHHRPSVIYFQDHTGLSTRTYLYVGDAPFVDLSEKIPEKFRRAYDEYLAYFRMFSLALGTLLSGEKKLVRKMALESLNTSYRKRAVMFFILSMFPTPLLKKAYKLYRQVKGLPMPKMVEVRIKDGV